MGELHGRIEFVAIYPGWIDLCIICRHDRTYRRDVYLFCWKRLYLESVSIIFGQFTVVLIVSRFFITFNLTLAILITLLCIAPSVQEANPRSGLAQASMVAAYCTYLVLSAVGNHTHESCNPLHKSAGATQTTTVIIGGQLSCI
jgi:Serine incorporator (Serinc)